MEAKILELRRNRKKEIFGLSTFVSAGFSRKSVLTEKVEKICLFVEGSLSFPELWWRELGLCAGRVCFLLRFNFPLSYNCALFARELFNCSL